MQYSVKLIIVVGESFDDNVSSMAFNKKGIVQLETAVDEGKVDIVCDG